MQGTYFTSQQLGGVSELMIKQWKVMYVHVVTKSEDDTQTHTYTHAHAHRRGIKNKTLSPTQAMLNVCSSCLYVACHVIVGRRIVNL